MNDGSLLATLCTVAHIVSGKDSSAVECLVEMSPFTPMLRKYKETLHDNQ